jgi:drug/metabolite transporter (DMT)-like permease
MPHTAINGNLRMPALSKRFHLPFRLPLRITAAIGPLLMLASALMFAVLDVLIKLMAPGYRIWDIAFYRWGLGFFILIIIFGWNGNPFKSHSPKLMAVRSITGCLTFLGLITAIRLIPISSAMVLFYCFPAFAAFFSFLIFRERISKGEIVCILAALAGVALLLDLKPGGNLFGYAIALISGAIAGLTVCLIKKLLEKDGPVVIYLYFCLLGAVISFPAYIAHPKIPASGIEWLMVGGIAGSSVIAQLLMNQGFRYCQSWEGGLFLTSEMVFTAMFGIFILGEITSLRFWLGGLLIFGSVILLNQLKVNHSRQLLAHLPGKPSEACVKHQVR